MSHPADSTNPAALGRRTFLKTGLGIAGAGVFPMALAGCSNGDHEKAKGGDSSNVETVSVRFNWTVKGEFTPFFVANAKGYYDEENLKVHLLEGKSGTQAVQVVGSGKDDFGYIPSIQVCEGINKGVPLKAVATVGRYTGMCWASWPDVPLKGPRSLYGHKVSISNSSTFFQVWPGFKKKFNIDTDKFKMVSPDPSARDGLFLDHKLDIMADIFYANDYVILQNKATKKLNLWRLSEVNFDPLGYLLVANTSLLKNKPEVVNGMVRATLKGLKYTLDNPDEAAKITTNENKKKVDGDVIKGQVHNMPEVILRKPALGRGTKKMWNASLDLLHSSGIIEKKMDLSKYYTNEFLS